MSRIIYEKEDRVYCPDIDTRIHVLEGCDDSDDVRIGDMRFNNRGFSIDSNSVIPKLFPATQEYRVILDQLNSGYGMFENPSQALTLRGSFGDADSIKIHRSPTNVIFDIDSWVEIEDENYSLEHNICLHLPIEQAKQISDHLIKILK